MASAGLIQVYPGVYSDRGVVKTGTGSSALFGVPPPEYIEPFPCDNGVGGCVGPNQQIAFYNSVLHDNYEIQKSRFNCEEGLRIENEVNKSLGIPLVSRNCAGMFALKPLPPLPLGADRLPRGRSDVYDTRPVLYNPPPPQTAPSAPSTPRPPGVAVVAPSAVLPPKPPTAAPPPPLVTLPAPPPTTVTLPKFAPIIAGGATAGPVGLIIGAALTGLFLIFGRGGVNSETRAAISDLRGNLVAVADTLQRFSWQIARSVGWLIVAIQSIWVRVLRPLIEKVQETIQRVQRIIDKVLKPYLDFLRKIREQILRIYEHYVAPLLILIQRIRKVLSILAALRVPFARKLDQKLGQIEGKIAGVFLRVLGYVNHLGGWMNVILNARLRIQLPIFVNSMNAYRSFMVASFYAAQSRPLGAGGVAQLAAESRPLTLNEATADFSSFAQGGFSRGSAERAVATADFAAFAQGMRG